MKSDRTIGLALAAVVASVAGCSDGGATPEAASTVTSVDSPALEFVLLRGEDWVLNEAMRPLTRSTAMQRVEPSLGWWAEYSRDRPVEGGIEGQDVRVSGHHVGLADQVDELTGAVMTPGAVGEHRAMLGVGADGEPAVVSIELRPDYTIVLLSYALSLDELRSVADELQPVSEDGWVAAGGVVVACLPPGLDCPVESTPPTD